MRVDHHEQEQVVEVLEAWWASNTTLVGHVHSPGQGRLGGMWSAGVAPFCPRCMSFIQGGILCRHRYVPDLGELGPEGRSSTRTAGQLAGIGCLWVGCRSLPLQSSIQEISMELVEGDIQSLTPRDEQL